MSNTAIIVDVNFKRINRWWFGKISKFPRPGNEYGGVISPKFRKPLKTNYWRNSLEEIFKKKITLCKSGRHASASAGHGTRAAPYIHSTVNEDGGEWINVIGLPVAQISTQMFLRTPT